MKWKLLHCHLQVCVSGHYVISQSKVIVENRLHIYNFRLGINKLLTFVRSWIVYVNHLPVNFLCRNMQRWFFWDTFHIIIDKLCSTQLNCLCLYYFNSYWQWQSYHLDYSNMTTTSFLTKFQKLSFIIVCILEIWDLEWLLSFKTNCTCNRLYVLALDKVDLISITFIKHIY